MQALGLPESYLQLANCPRVAALTTVAPNGQPQTTVVWTAFDGHHVLVNTMRGFRKERNMRQNPKVTILAYDPRHPLQYLEVRGTVVEMTEKGAVEQLDELSILYTGQAPYFGKCVPENLREVEFPVICRILATHVVSLDSNKNRHAKVVYDAQSSKSKTFTSLRPVVPESFPGCPIPASHLNLLENPFHGVLTTMMPDGQPQSSLVWYSYDGKCVTINTTMERQKGKNMLANPRVSLLIVDPENTSRYVQIQGLVEVTLDGAIEDLDQVTRRYTQHPRYYGYIYPVEQMARETRVICRVHASKVTLDAIHK